VQKGIGAAVSFFVWMAEKSMIGSTPGRTPHTSFSSVLSLSLKIQMQIFASKKPLERWNSKGFFT
ncbi:MAG: hypothetical protein ACI4W2_04460, partial [Eubacterium sp.]